MRPGVVKAVQALSDVALEGAIRDLSRSGQWPERLRLLREERYRRQVKRRGSAMMRGHLPLAVMQFAAAGGFAVAAAGTALSGNGGVCVAAVAFALGCLVQALRNLRTGLEEF